MVAHNACDLLVIVNFREDALSNDWMLLHESPFLKRQRSRLLQEARRKPNRSDVVDEATQVGHSRVLR